MSSKARWLVSAAVAVALVPAGASAAGSRVRGAPASGTWTPVASMHQQREGGGGGQGGLAAVLHDGRVLVAGGFATKDGVFKFDDKSYYLSGSEVYDPASGTWTVTDRMHRRRFGPVMITLRSGKVLAAGGYAGGFQPPHASAELFDPRRGTWTMTGRMGECRAAATASPLRHGRVLVVGGYGCGFESLSSAEIYQPATGRWTRAASMHVPRWGHDAVVLDDGRILVTGGRQSAVAAADDEVTDTAEIYDPAGDAWTTTGPMHLPRVFPSTGLLEDGRVIAAGGRCAGPACPASGHTATAELFDPATGTWTMTSSMQVERLFSASIVLSDGRFMMAGGESTAEVYDPGSATWAMTGRMGQVREDAQLVPVGRSGVLAIGGFEMTPAGYFDTETAELFHP